MVNNGNFILLLTCSGQEWQFHIATDIQWVKNDNFNGNFILLLTCSGQEWQFHNDMWSRMPMIFRGSGQQWQFHIVTDMAIYGQEWQWQFHIFVTDI